MFIFSLWKIYHLEMGIISTDNSADRTMDMESLRDQVEYSARKWQIINRAGGTMHIITSAAYSSMSKD
jgi:hypothetical protein